MSDNTTIHRAAFWMMVEKEIGRGMSRVVWDSSMFPNSVVKVEEAYALFQNVIEWETWKKVEHTDYAKWFAPCEWVSSDGAILIMKKTRQPALKDYPAKMPYFLTDFKQANYGMIGKNFVCHDYGTNLLMEHGMSNRLRKANWREE